MKKVKLCLIMAICIVYLVGCDSQIERDIAGLKDTTVISDTTEGDELIQYDFQFSENRINITEYQNRYENEIIEIKGSKFQNIIFQDCEIMPIEGIDTVGIYRLYSENMGVDETIEFIKGWLKNIGCDDIDLEKELRDATGQYEGSNEEYPYDYPAVFDHYPDFDSGRGFFLNTNRCYIQMGSGGIYSMSDGSITAFLNLDGFAAMDALGINQENIVDKGMVSQLSDNVWDLADGEMSIADAAEIVENYFEAGTPKENPDNISIDAPEVEVFILGDKYGYAFKVRRVYKGIPFAYAATGTRTYYGSDYEIIEDMKRAYVINHDRVSAFTGYSDAEQLEPLMEEETDIISLKDAIMMLDDFLAANVRLKVSKVGLVYCPHVDKSGNKVVYPCWQFQGINQTNNQLMRFYINVLTGEIYYYSYVEE